MATGPREKIGAVQKIELDEAAIILGVSKRTLVRTIEEVCKKSDLSRRKPAVVAVAEIFCNCPKDEDVKAGQVFQAVGGQVGQSGINNAPIVIEEFILPVPELPTNPAHDMAMVPEESPEASTKALTAIFGSWVSRSVDKSHQPISNPTLLSADKKTEKLNAQLTAELKKIVERSQGKSGRKPWNSVLEKLRKINELGMGAPLGAFENQSFSDLTKRAIGKFVSFGDFVYRGKPADTWLFIELISDRSLIELFSVTLADIEGGRLVELTLKQWSEHFMQSVAKKKADEEALVLEEELKKHEIQLKNSGSS